MNNDSTHSAVSALLVPDADRLNFLPRQFGPLLLVGKASVYHWLRAISPDYSGGYWQFYELSNCGFYMAPADRLPLRLAVDGNGFSGTVSADAAGIVATLFALCALAAEHAESAVGDRLAEQFHALRDFALGHSEAASIFNAID